MYNSAKNKAKPTNAIYTNIIILFYKFFVIIYANM